MASQAGPRDKLPYVSGDELTKDTLFQKTGRELGPDIQLNVKMDEIPQDDRPGQKDSFVDKSSLGAGTGNPKGFITSTSSITEILNIVGYLCNKKRDATVIDTENSIDITNAIHGNDGNYVGTDQAGAIDGSLFLDAAGPGHQLFDLNTLDARAPTNKPDILPVGIIKRILADGKTLKGYTNTGHIEDETDVKNLMSDSIKQMIHILEQTRTIFGPKGWTTLFNQVKGGNANKNQAKRTHRQHRRRYSSKHY
jgi:hypothetical protein